MQNETGYKRGLDAEKSAKNYFAQKGYKILAERFKTPHGEIDLIALKGNTLVFIEVKLRKNTGAAAEAISQKNQSRVYRAAELYIQQNPMYSDHEMRFDAYLLSPSSAPEHIENAWGF